MRREWSGWIRNRQWGEFEKLAKVEPSQALADTVAELELGFPEKPDRRALRKVLYLLSQAGFEPREIDVETVTAKPAAAIERAFMVSPDGVGDVVITYCHEERGRVAWLVTHLTSRLGVTSAIEETTTIDDAIVRLMRYQTYAPAPFICSEIPVDFALTRLSKAVSITKSLPPVMAYWRALLPKEVAYEHPSAALARTTIDDQVLREFMANEEAMYGWRLELGTLAPLINEMHEQQADIDPGSPSNADRWLPIFESARRQFFSEAVIEDHRIRLLDLAYLMHLKGNLTASTVLCLADNLQEVGPDSLYARHILNDSLAMYVQTLRAVNAKNQTGT